ncbi:MAG TPA: DUF5953 family protein, partial [Myxococcus sp.]|nr:DUF5953 family protein [Myxococcus sp.]
MAPAQSPLHLAVYAPALVGDDGRPLSIVHGMEQAVPGLRLGWTSSERGDLIPLSYRDEWVRAYRTDNGFPFLCNDDDNRVVTLTGWENALGLGSGGPPHLEVHATLPHDAAGIAATAAALEAVGEAARAFWGHVLPAAVADAVAQQYRHPGDERSVPPHRLPWLKHSRCIPAPAIPHCLGWWNYWSGAAARALGFPDPSRDAELLSRARRTPSGGWVVQLTEAPLDLGTPAHLEALLRAYERFPEIGGATSLDFQWIVEGALVPGEVPAPSEYAQIPCGDRWVFPCLDGARWHYRPIPTRRDNSAVLLILESPHTSEFSRVDGKFVAVGPAADFRPGKTGGRIHRFLEEKYLSPISRYRPGSPVFLVNAVQYQCSLNKTPLDESVRNKVFARAWEKGGKEDFIARLSRYYRDGDIVINACTGTKKQQGQENLKMLVEGAVISALQNRDGRRPFQINWGMERTVISDLGTHHPSSACFQT